MSLFYDAIKERITDDAQADAAEWFVPYKSLIAELAQLGTMPATKAVCDRIHAIEADLNGWRDDYVHDLMVAYSNEGDDDAWENAERETPGLESLIEAKFAECVA